MTPSSKDPQVQAETKHSPGPIEQLLRDQEKEINRLRDVQKELLEALKAVVHRLERIDGFGCPQILIDEMREAIAKAEKQP